MRLFDRVMGSMTKEDAVGIIIAAGITTAIIVVLAVVLSLLAMV